MTYHNVLSIIDNESEKFDSVITKTEKAMLSAAVNAIKKLDVDASGNIRTTTANIKLLATIRTKLATVASNKEFMGGVKSVANAMDKLYKAQVEYYSKAFPQKTLGENAKKKHQALQQIAISNVASGLSQSALTASVVEPLNKILLRAVTSGAKYADLIDEFHKQLESSDDSTSALAKYAKTYATTAMTQLAGENNRLFTDDLGAEWFQYVGSIIETSRQFCELLTEKEYIHKSEFKDILAGYIEIDGKVHECEMNPRTGLPKGLIEGTTPDNFQVNVGGWNCRHQLIPIAAEMVPAHIRAKFKKLSPEEILQQKEAEEKAQQIKDFKQFVEKYKGLKDIDATAVENAINKGDMTAIADITSRINGIVDALNDLSPIIPNVMGYAQQFTFAELKGAANSVQNTMQTWLTKHGYGTIEKADPLHLKAKCEQEIGALKSAKKYATWDVAVQAYEKHIKQAERQLALNAIAGDIATLKAYKTKSSQYKQYIAEAEQAFAVGNITKAKSLIATAQAKQIELEKRHSSQAKGTPKIDIGNTTEQMGHVTDSGPREEIIGKLTGTSDSKTIEQYLKAVNGFSWRWDWEIRQIQCGNTSFTSRHGHSLSEIKQRADDLEKFITKSPKWAGGTTYRGMSLSQKEIEQLRADLQAGRGNMQGAASWSTRESCSQGFAGSHIGEISPVYGDRKSIRVVLVAHRHKKATSIKYLSEFPSEDEVLSSKDCRWRVVREYTKGGYTYFDVEPSN